MANNKSNKISMDFEVSSLCLDRNDAQIRQFNIFNDRNSPIYGGSLSPYYTKDRERGSTNIGIDAFGNVWSVSDTTLKKNNEDVVTVSRYAPFREVVKDRFIYSQKRYNGNEIIRCYQSGSDNRWYVKKDDGTPVDLGIGSDNYAATFEKIPSYNNREVYLFVLWNYTIGRVFIKYVDITTMTVFHTINTDILSQLQANEFNINNPFINVGCIAINNAKSGFIGISLFPESGTKIQPIEVVKNIIIPNNPESSSYYIVWDKDVHGGSSNIQLVKGSGITDNNVKICNEFAFFPYMQAEGCYLVRPYFTGSYFNGLFFPSLAFPVFQGGLTVSNIAHSNSKITITINSFGYYYDTTVIGTGYYEGSPNVTSKFAYSYTFYKNYYRQYVGVWKDTGAKQNNFLSFKFTNTVFQTGNGVSTEGATSPSDMKLVYNGIGDKVDMINIDTRYKLLLNEGLISGISDLTDKLLTPWYDINDIELPCIGYNECYYKSIDGNRYKISSSRYNGVKHIIDNRYIILLDGTVYDSKTGNIFCYNIGYNNIIINGFNISENTLLTSSEVESYGLDKDKYLTLIASTINNHYEVTGIPFTGTQWAIQRLYGFSGTNLRMTSNNEYQFAELYIGYSDTTTTPYYSYEQKTINGNLSRKNSRLEGLPYSYTADNPIYSLSIFSEIIDSYNMNDFVIDGYRAYPIMYSNNELVFAYMALNFIENVKSIFVIQGTTYMIANNYILRILINNYRIALVEGLVKIEGFVYCGASLKEALFFSPVQKSFFVFTGDITLSEITQANVIDNINHAEYVQSIGSIVLSVKEYDSKYYIYFFKNGMFTHKIPVDNFINKILATEKSSLLIRFVDNKAIELKLEYDSEYTKHNIKLKTAFFGLGSENTQIVDCWYFRIFSDNLPKNGKFIIKQNTLTNTGVSSNSKTIDISPGMFDILTKTMLIRFQPKYQAAVGFQLEIESDYPIYEIVGSVTQDTTQISKVNI